MPIDYFVITFEPCNCVQTEPNSRPYSDFRRLAQVGRSWLPDNDADGAWDYGDQSDWHFVDVHSGVQCTNTLTEPILGSVEVQLVRSLPMNEQSTQMAIAALAYALQCLFISGHMFPRNQSQPR